MTQPARSFQHYEVLRRDDGTPWELGRGTMGITYKAFDVNLCCEVALKVVSSALVEHPEARERFVREARAAAALRHRNVASVYHLGNDGEHFFYAMEFINGETLDALVRRRGPLSVVDTLRVVLQVARALAAAERQHLVHRDIKPANLMITHEDADEETVVKVIDFGLARTAANTDDASPLTIGGFVGTPQYASPEQLEERPLDARSDLYSLGITAWFLLTGRVPFTGSLATICQQQLTQPPPWEQLPVTVPTCVRGLLGHLLAKDAVRRPQNAAELRVEIEACLEKVQGTARKQDLHLPTVSPTAAAPRDDPGKTAPRTPQTGTMLNGRYRLLREIGGHHGIRVFQGRDESAGEKPVAVKILPGALTSTPTGRGRLAEEVRLIRAAAHPGWVPILALERAASMDAMFLVEEWLAGFTLRDLLAGRGGALLMVEALRLLEQAAAAADQAASCRLERLDLALTKWHVTFPGLATSTDDDLQVRALLPKSVSDWPDWTLKIHAFRIVPDPLTLDTWAGGATLVTTGTGGANRPYVPALASLVYELLGGTPTVHQQRKDAAQPRPALLPVLSEEGNLLLQQAWSGESAFVHGWELHQALARAIGEGPARGTGRTPTASPGRSPTVVAAKLPIPVAAAFFEQDPAQENAATSYAFAHRPEPGAVPPYDESVAGFFHDEHAVEVHGSEGTMAGSAWERLTLVTGKRAHPGRWLAGIVGMGVVFTLGFAGVLAWLWQQPPAQAARTPPAKKRTPELVASARNHPPVRAPTPAPLAATSLIFSPPARSMAAAPMTTPVSARTENTPSLQPAAVARAENIPPPPASAAPPFVPGVEPVRERSAMVRLDSVPPGAQIRLGEEILGTTPLRVKLPRGDYQLIARYQDWPETRQTIHLDGTETRAAVEIRLMRPDLVPGLVVQTPGGTDNRARRIPAPAARQTPTPDPPAPQVGDAQGSSGAHPPIPSTPEVQPALRVLTPFRIDEPTESTPSSPLSSPENRQPFSTENAGDH